MAQTRAQRQKRNRYIFAGLIGMVVMMNGFAYATVPAYRAFCQKFGFAGTPRVEASAPATENILIERLITIRFNSDIDTSLNWRFRPVQRSIDLHVGETGLAFFEAKNRHETEITGTATFNVTPLKAASYFVKIQCFCFTEQTLEPGETAQMPVTFYVDPEIAKDKNLDDVKTITLSYTFFRDHDADAAREAAAVVIEEKTRVN